MDLSLAENLALARDSIQSGEYWGLTADRAVDQNSNPHLNNRHCAAACQIRTGVPVPDKPRSAWWMVHIGTETQFAEVSSVTVYGSDTDDECE